MSTFNQNLTSHNVAILVPKFGDADPDIRFMSLSDLAKILTTAPPTLFANDLEACGRLVDALIRTLDDTNGDVQSQALKCLGPLAAKAPADMLAPMVEKLSNIKTENSMDSSIPPTALRSLILAFPHPVQGNPQPKPVNDAWNALSKVLVPRMIGHIVVAQSQKVRYDIGSGMLDSHPQKGVDTDALDLLIELIRCYGSMFVMQEKLAFQNRLLEILDEPKAGNIVRKKTVTTISVLAVYLEDDLLSPFMSKVTDGMRNSDRNLKKRRFLIAVVGSLARTIPSRLGRYIPMLVPLILKVLSKAEYDRAREDLGDDAEVDLESVEIKEAAFITLEALLVSCPLEMRPFVNELVDDTVRYITFNPGMVADDDHNMEEDSEADRETEMLSDAEEDFEEEAGMSDDDDGSWKIRRCAAKVLLTIISTRSASDAIGLHVLYQRLAPVLVKCLKEKEESVRLEVLSVLGILVRKRGEESSIALLNSDEDVSTGLSRSKSRKRRRGGSDASMADVAAVAPYLGVDSPLRSPSPIASPRSDYSRYNAGIVDGVTKLLAIKSIPTVQAAATFLKEFCAIYPGGLSLSEQLDKIMGPLDKFIAVPDASNLPTSNSSSGTSSANRITLRIACLQLLATICNTHSTKTLAPFIGSAVESTVAAVTDSYFKISAEALRTSESLIRLITPPRSSGLEQQLQPSIRTLSNVILEKASAASTDLEVRQRAIHAIGTLLARVIPCTDPRLIPDEEESKALDLLFNRMKLEVTRLDSVQAIVEVAASLGDETILPQSWVRNAALELAAQLRKSDRQLRGASLKALRQILASLAARQRLDDQTVRELTQMLIPQVNASSLDLLAQTVSCLTALIERSPEAVISPDLNTAIIEVVKAPLGGSIIEALLRLVQAIGEAGSGKRLMQDLLKKVGVNGDPGVAGASIGALLVAGGASVGVKLDDFITELRSQQDDRRRCLALSVLGEAGLRMGSTSPLTPVVFTEHFKSKSEQVSRAAASALGKAGANNTTVYLPVILEGLQTSDTKQSLWLHSIKEILDYAGKQKVNISQYTAEIWKNLLKASSQEDNKAIGAECIGRLNILEPQKYLPQLPTYLKDPSDSLRSTIIQAFRFALTENEPAFDKVLKPILVPTLITMLQDTSLENRRAALTTLTSATSHKVAMILPSMNQILPIVINESFINPALIREVKMGPFKHKVDDGLDLRKSAYDTLNALLSTSSLHVSPGELYARIIPGLADDHEIKLLCLLMTNKLLVVAPEETQRQLDPLAEKFRAIIATKPKDNAVKQDIEKAQEVNKSVLQLSLKMMAELGKADAANQGGSVGWTTYCEAINRQYRQLGSAPKDTS
ncbi:hypothetical protein MMC25_002587 [Agyrium rufum]|nr:hypothetical protein [Agyrium rufum]